MTANPNSIDRPASLPSTWSVPSRICCARCLVPSCRRWWGAETDAIYGDRSACAARSG